MQGGRKEKEGHTKNWKRVAITIGAGAVFGVLVAVVVRSVLVWALPKHEPQAQPIKQEFEIHKLQKDFKVKDLGVSVV